ncbi:hypothetical protein SAMN05880556_111119 [Azospirillum sp. RU38E]|nr:hypothetical protein SAMN05880556_111119 [Azospirillum sp. RU38E]SNS95353.1 hypothetical protein SAMN05880591_111119 [Azospirillum sp. RU37A]
MIYGHAFGPLNRRRALQRFWLRGMVRAAAVAAVSSVMILCFWYNVSKARICSSTFYTMHCIGYMPFVDQLRLKSCNKDWLFPRETER